MAVCISIDDCVDERVVLWGLWANAAKGADAGVSIHSLDADSLRSVLARLPCKERYFAVCKLFRLELLALATSARRLRGRRSHCTHARARDRALTHPDRRRRRAALAPLPRASSLRSLSDTLAGSRADGWSLVLTDAAARTRLASLFVSFVPCSGPAAGQFASALPECVGLTKLVLVSDGTDVAEALAALPSLPKLRSFELQYSGATTVDLALLASLPVLEQLSVTGVAAGDDVTPPAGALQGEALWDAARVCARLTSVTLSARWTARADTPEAPWSPPASRPPTRAPLASVTVNFTQRNLEHFLLEQFYVLEPLLADLAALPALQHLRFSSCHDPEYTAVRDLLQHLVNSNVGAFPPKELLSKLAAHPAWPRLRTLHLNFQPRAGVVAAVDTPLPTALRSLSLRAHDELVLALLCDLTQCPVLTQLSLERNDACTEADEPALDLLAGFFRSAPALESLTVNHGLEGSGLSPFRAASAFFGGLQHLRGLTRLRLDVTGVVSLEPVAKALPRGLAALGVLGMTPAAAAPLLEALPRLPRLAELDASRCRRAVLPGLAAALPRCTALRVLVLEQVFADEGERRAGCLSIRRGACPWAALAAALPRCTSLEVVKIGSLDNGPPGSKAQGAAGLGNVPAMAAALERALPHCRSLREVELAPVSWLGHNFWCYVWTWKYPALLVCLWVGVALGVHFDMPPPLAYVLVTLCSIVTAPGAALLLLWVLVLMFCIVYCCLWCLGLARW